MLLFYASFPYLPMLDAHYRHYSFTTLLQIVKAMAEVCISAKTLQNLKQVAKRNVQQTAF